MTTARGIPEGDQGRRGRGRGRSTRPIHVATLRRCLEQLGKSVEQLAEESLGSANYVSARTLYRALRGEPLERTTRASIAHLVGIALDELESGPKPSPASVDRAPPASAEPRADATDLAHPLPAGSAGRRAARRRWAGWGGLLAAIFAVAAGVVPQFSQPPVRPLEGVVVPPGTFIMGSTPESDPEREPDEGPLTEVTITRPLWVKAHEVTQQEFEAVLGINPSTQDGCGPDCPVTSISWWDAAYWSIERSRLDGFESCYVLRGCTGDPGTPSYQCEYMTFRGLHCNGYRLPTDAEWEYFARAGATGTLYTGDLVVRGKNWGEGLDAIAWYGGNSGVAYEPAADCSTWPEMEYPSQRCGVHPVGTKAPNSLGIYDVLGSAAEWTMDAYLERLPGGSVRDPIELQGDFDGPVFRVLRGGAWDWDAQWLRLANRAKERAATRQRSIGFRPVRTVRDEEAAQEGTK